MLNTGISLQRLATKAGVGFTPKKLFSNGEAGVWYDPSDVEASLTWRRNLLEYTESFDNSYYTGYFQKPTFTTGQADPLGGNNAMKWNASTTTGSSDGAKGGFYRPDNDGIIKPNTDYTVSVWLKATAPIAVSVGLMDGGYTTVTATTSWQRFSVTVQKSTNPVHGSRLIQIVEHTNADVDIYIFGAQTEEGSTATEYQPIRTTFDNAFKQAFPKHTLYQDTDGIAPVTGLGQAVGLMLDKSQGLQFSDELITNGNFATNSDWVKGAGWSISNGTAVSSGTSGISIYQTGVFTVNKTYKITADVVLTSGELRVWDASGGQPTLATSSGSVSLIFTPTAVTELYLLGASNFVGTVDNVSVQEVLGSHATQSDSTKRPVFARHPERGRVNLFKYTEEFDNGFYDKGTNAVVTANHGVAPNGTQTADRLELPATGSTFISGPSNLPVNNGSVYTFSVYVKATSGTSNFDLYYNFGNTIQVGQQTATSEWQRFDYTVTASATTGTFGINNASDTYASDILIWGAQLEEANEATGYQKVVDDYDITESGYKSVYYLQFDGVNDCLTAPLDMSGTAQVSHFTGHRKIGTSNSILIETSAYGPSTNGTFRINAPHSNTIRYMFSSRGTGGQDTNVSRSDFDEPFTAVTGYSANIATNTQTVRVNGELIATNTNNLGSGNYGSHSLNIGSRDDGATLSFNGYIYQLVIVGASTTDKEKDQAEEFVAIKTGLKSEVVGLATLDLNFGANTYTARNSNGSVL